MSKNNNNEMARMRFQSGRNANERGSLVITEDGFIEIEPSEEFVTEMAHLEEEAVQRSRRLGLVGAGLFFGIGVLIAAVAWVMGRIGGQMRETITSPRPVEAVQLETNDRGGLRIIVPGTGPQKVTLEWEAGEIDSSEAARFVAVYNRYKEASGK